LYFAEVPTAKEGKKKKEEVLWHMNSFFLPSDKLKLEERQQGQNPWDQEGKKGLQCTGAFIYIGVIGQGLW